MCICIGSYAYLIQCKYAKRCQVKSKTRSLLHILQNQNLHPTLQLLNLHLYSSHSSSLSLTYGCSARGQGARTVPGAKATRKWVHRTRGAHLITIATHLVFIVVVGFTLNLSCTVSTLLSLLNVHHENCPKHTTHRSQRRRVFGATCRVSRCLPEK